jgi:hypothetical protein
MKNFFDKVWTGIKAFFVWLIDLVTDEKNQGDERRVLGIACYVVGLYLALSIPSLVLGVKDLASAGAMAAVIAILFGAGASLLNIARKADAAILSAPIPDVGEIVSAAVTAIRGELAAKPEAAEPEAKAAQPAGNAE